MSEKAILLEVAVASVEDALAATEGGADRIELNSALALGGLTPSLGTVLEVRRQCALPMVVMIRPRPGGFCYSATDFRTALRDLQLMKHHGVTDFAFGMLTETGAIDVPRCRDLVTAIGDGHAVFHRAFDLVPDTATALEQLIDLGVRRVMTSGQEETAYNGIATIQRLFEQARGRIEILPAGGINRFNVADIVARTGCTQIHAGLRTKRLDPSGALKSHITFGATFRSPEDRFDAVDPGAVTTLRQQL
jgi:copper homeostasis protein